MWPSPQNKLPGLSDGKLKSLLHFDHYTGEHVPLADGQRVSDFQRSNEVWVRRMFCIIVLADGFAQSGAGTS